MSDLRKDLAALTAKAKAYVEAERGRHPTARVISSTPMKSSASVKEAELIKALERVPSGAAGKPGAKPLAALAAVKVAFVTESALPEDSAAGKLLSKIIQAMGLLREDAAIVKLSALAEALPQLKPKALVALGDGAARALCQTEQPLSALRGRFAEYQGLPLMPTHHPVEVSKNEALKRHVWEDMKLVAAKLKP